MGFFNMYNKFVHAVLTNSEGEIGISVDSEELENSPSPCYIQLFNPWPLDLQFSTLATIA